MSVLSFRLRRPDFKALFDIRARLILLALILVVPLMLDRVRTLEENRNRQIHAASSELLNVARRGAQAQREMIRSVESVLRTSAAVFLSSQRLDRPCALLNNGLKVQLEGIGNISIANKDGRIVCSSQPNAVGLNISDRIYFHQALTRNSFVLSDYVISKSQREPSVVAAFPTSALVAGSDHVVITSVALTWFEELIGRFNPRSGVTISLVDSEGSVLAAQPPMENSATNRALLTKIVSSNDNELSGSVPIDDTDNQRSFSAVRIPDTSARLIVSIDNSALLGTIDRNISTAYFQLAMVGVLLLLGAWYLSERLIIRPIRSLTNTAARFGAGDFSARSLRIGLPPEFMPLANAFNRMAMQLAERERELLSSNDRLTVLASLDAVSGLANRRGFNSRLDFEWMRAIQMQGSVALAMLDIDHFKQFNDTYGHPEGDACLATVGKTLSQLAIDLGGFGARYGGEEFAFLLPAASPEEATAMGEAIRAAIEALAIPHSGSVHGHVTVSVGIAVMSPTDEDGARMLVEAADSGLYAAKRRGRNTVVEHGAIRTLDSGIAMAG